MNRQEVPLYLLERYQSTIDELCSTCPLAGEEECYPAYGIKMLRSENQTRFDLVDLAIQMQNETSPHSEQRSSIKRITLNTDEVLSRFDVVEAFDNCQSAVILPRRILANTVVCSALNQLLGLRLPLKENMKIQDL